MSRLLFASLIERARRAPEQILLETAEHRWTARELDDTSDRLAATLRDHGVRRGDRVGLLLPKCAPAYIAMHAILKLGAAIVPLDFDGPSRRAAQVIDDSGMRVLVATKAGFEGLEDEHWRELRLIVLVDAAGDVAMQDRHPLARVRTWEEVSTSPGAFREQATTPDDLAYILFTSGSTGRPKGVMLSHRNAVAFVDWAWQTLDVRAEDRVAGVADLHFDLSMFDTFSTIAAGATLIPLPPHALRRPRQVSEWIHDQRISVWYSTPSTLILLLNHGDLAAKPPPTLRLVLFAGEVFPVRYLEALQQALPDAELVNLYGPTETNVCTYHRVTALPKDGRDLPIGCPCEHTDVQILDGKRRPVEKQTVGELWVRGPTVMQGYWNDSRRTARALKRLPRQPADDDRPWYRTGDLVHWDEDDRLRFHGRRDHQVKVRGYRIELGEIESAMYRQLEVAEAAVGVVAEDVVAELVAWVVPEAGSTISPLALKRALRRDLPAYMIPADIVIVDALPKTTTGKVDRRRLVASYDRGARAWTSA